MPNSAEREKTHPNATAFPAGLSGPALRALSTAGITSMAQLAQHSKADLAAMHGMGPKGMRMLEEELKRSGQTLRQER
ncbi:MAG TPA: hypothetical protein DGD08_05295 [Gemmatimonas aurantiaca]|uniref:DNA-binding protein n=2 Tax=Gemmatimonas aurantiaca TaxID=173480 RepID=C1A6H8_GEMAT|nr:hypothetical protein [Gemmatimonas aurantiaca]BAH37838.1 hypothetical protein GAU_0796 [Gemmatimonas aurantiaca T-27]HCT56614.1 hypothetical protein [Gemmatimonas aurantiaca]